MTVEPAPLSRSSSIIALPVEETLDVVPNHTSIPEIERLVFHGIPHLASVHTITQADTAARDYCQPHHHSAQDELNLFLGTTDDFRFRITLDGSEHVLGPVAALLIPAGESHSANVLSGSGYYVVFKIPADGSAPSSPGHVQLLPSTRSTDS